VSDESFDQFFDVDEKREEARLNIAADIFIETVSQEPGEKKPAEVVQCECVDLSANGLQVLVAENLKPGAIHTLIIDINGKEKVFRLTAEVRWVKPYKSDFLTGLFLYDSAGTAIIDWKFLMAKYLN